MNSTAKEAVPPGAAKPPIALVPEPTLEEQLKRTLGERDALAARCDHLLEDVKDLKTQLDELEGNSLTFALNNLDAGSVLADAGKQLGELTAIVQRRQQKGTFTLKLTVKPFKGEALIFIPDVKITEPKPEPAQSIFYANDDGKLSRNDPRQREFGFARPDVASGIAGTAEDKAHAHERANPELR